MAAAAVLVGALGIFVSGHIEALGSLGGRVVIDMADLPLGYSKSEYVRDLANRAESADVDLALLVPDRSGTPASFDAYALHGDVTAGTFWATISERPLADIDDAVIVWTYVVDGEGSAVERFLVDLRSAGYVFSDSSPSPLLVVAALIQQPDLLAVAVAVMLGVGIALVAESHRRTPRTRLRRLSGWSRARIAFREGSAISALFATMFLPLSVGIIAVLVVRAAPPLTVGFCLGTIAVLGAVSWATITTVHILCSVAGAPSLARLGAPRWRPVATGCAGVALMAVLTADVSALVAQVDSRDRLEQQLVSEARHGDDITLGVGLTDYNQDHSLGLVGTRAIDASTAHLSSTNLLTDVLVVSGGAPGLPPSSLRGDDGITVLVPLSHHATADQVVDELRREITDGWDIEGVSAPRTIRIRTVPVETTTATVEAADRWVEWGLPPSAAWPNIPVAVVSDVRDLAPNRIGTAVHNGEVRFTDRAALTTDLRGHGVYDTVTQFNRVGATIEREIAELRANRIIALIAAAAAAVAALFVVVTLAEDRRARTRARWRLRSLFGASAARHNAPFIAGTSAVGAATVAAVLLAEHMTTWAVAACSAGVGGIIVAILLTSAVTLTHRRERINR